MKRSFRDMYLVAALLSYGAQLEGRNVEDRSQQRFIFLSPPKRIFIWKGDEILHVDSPSFETIESHFLSEALLYPPTYPATIRKVKRMIYAAYKDYEEDE